MSITLTPEEQAFKDAYVRSRGYWVAFNDGLLRYNPRWIEGHLAYADAVQSEGPLDVRTRELIFIAVDASTTHLYLQGLDIHIREAFASGCSAADLIEVLLIAAMQGLDSVIAGVELLTELAPATAAIDELIVVQLLDRYAAVRGDRPTWLAVVATMTPLYAQALVDLIENDAGQARLTDSDRALIRLYLAASPTHLYRPAMRSEIRAAMVAGATSAEILEVFQLVGLLGLHACVDGIPAVIAADAECNS